MYERDTEGVSGVDHSLLAAPEYVPLYIPYIFEAKPGGLTQIFSKNFFREVRPRWILFLTEVSSLPSAWAISALLIPKK